MQLTRLRNYAICFNAPPRTTCLAAAAPTTLPLIPPTFYLEALPSSTPSQYIIGALFVNMLISSLIGILTKILVVVLKLLEQQDIKQIRLVNYQYRHIATPLCFKVVIFNISKSSISNLVNILKNSLAKHLRTLVLKRRRRF